MHQGSSVALTQSNLNAFLQGTWRAAIYNPMRIYKLGYTIKLSKQANCLNDCSGHGDCTEDGICNCHDNWAGGDCSIQPLEPCQEGSRKPVDRSVVVSRRLGLLVVVPGMRKCDPAKSVAGAPSGEKTFPHLLMMSCHAS